ncbi:hypothetical protein FJ934_09595 [Mesorhizobium sp. B2-4-12]|uniref:hypothetical protein n=1 Tax=Mesorhizobium sp. B2-4-12 TaxID=2589937 RepID=UPI0011266FD5|nr:hypothetical protein [Mesorhizobium sp. B2-4-12]TPK96390.1 hypothetical protein FJ934_09595 [Mesorhizobium sp. B2-4-12]
MADRFSGQQRQIYNNTIDALPSDSGFLFTNGRSNPNDLVEEIAELLRARELAEESGVAEWDNALTYEAAAMFLIAKIKSR